VLPRESQLRPRAGDKVRVGNRDLVWKPYRAGDYFIDFNEFVGKVTEDSVAYAVCYIESDTERNDVALRIGSDDQSRVYLNGQEVYRYLGWRPLLVDQNVVYKLTLRRGTNVLVFKVVNGAAQWQGCLRFVDRQGQPLEGLRVRLTPEP
jgi:hypothetical protein